MSTTNYTKAAIQALLTSTLIMAVATVGYFFMEPQVGRAQDTSGPFTISQVITGETAFIVDAVNTTLSGSINGITGGTANGSTTVAVRTNSPTGYTMTIAFFNNGTANAMLGSTTGSIAIRDYPAAGGQPTYLFSTASTSSVFGYTVTSVDAGDLDQSFDDNGSACNQTGNAQTADRCWMEPMTSAYQIIDRSTDAVTGATSTIHFRVHVPNSPTPGVVSDTYIATATLTVAPK